MRLAAHYIFVIGIYMPFSFSSHLRKVLADPDIAIDLGTGEYAAVCPRTRAIGR
jgi:hypothetical protein